MAWAAALGGIIGSGSEGMASAAQYQASKHERNRAWQRAQAWELMRPSLQVEGLKRAGINPMVPFLGHGVGGGGGGMMPPMATTGGSPSFDKDTVGRAVSSAKSMALMKDQAEILRLQKAEQAEKTSQAVIDTNVKQKFAEAMARAELAVSQEQMLNLVAQRGLTSARTAESEQAKARIYIDRLLMEMGVPGARAMEEMYEKYPWLRQVREFSGGGLGGAAIGAGAGAAGFLGGRLRKTKKDLEDPFGSMTPNKKKRGKRYGR